MSANSNSKQDKIVDIGQWKYFSIMPHMADDDLDPYQYRLYGHYKRVCGVNGGTCWESTKTTADKTKMSAGKVVSTRRELAELGFISINEDDGKTLTVTVTDIMPENMNRYRSSDEPTVHHMNADRSPHEPKNNSFKNNQEESKDSIATAKNAADDDAVEASPEEPNATPPEVETTDTASTVQDDDWFVELLSSEEDVDRRLAVAKEVSVPPRPAETVKDGKFVKGLTKTEWFKRLEEIITAFTSAPGYKVRETSNWLVKESSYDIPDLLSAWTWVRKNKPELSLPYSTSSPQRGLCWAFGEWEKSKPVKIAPPEVDDEYEVLYVPGGTVKLHKVNDAEKIAELKAVS